MRLLVTGGLGFIGSNFIKWVLKNKYKKIDLLINYDSITYAADWYSDQEHYDNSKYFFKEGNISNPRQVCYLFSKHKPTHVVNFAAETHVDNSIKNPKPFIETNILGTFTLLEYAKITKIKRFHHISTDEVYGELGSKGKFKETTPYAPRNPYAATKASSDMIVQAYNHTYGVPTTISNCSNNYGSAQHKEKFIPTVIDSILNNKKIPLYGNGKNIRDWIYVEDHCSALWKILTRGKIGETYNVGASCEKTNIDVIKAICGILNVDFDASIEYVKDRAAHDYRYAIDATKIKKELGWKPKHTFIQGLKKTVKYYA